MSEDEDAVEQEREVDAEPGVEPVEEAEDDELEEEVEVENEDRESEKIEEREDGMASHPKSKKPLAKIKKAAKRSAAKPQGKSR